MKLLVAIEDEKLRNSLISAFQHKKYIADSCENCKDMVEYVWPQSYDCIIVENIQHELTIESTKKLRKKGIVTPIVIISKYIDVSFRIALFDAGVDDIIPVQVPIQELLVRLKSLLRRYHNYHANVIAYHGLVLNCDLRELSYKEKKDSLTSIEFQILEKMISRAEVIVTIDTLIRYVWGWNKYVDYGSVWTHISNLRRKIKKIEAPVRICSIKGVGYVLKQDKN